MRVTYHAKDASRFITAFGPKIVRDAARAATNDATNKARTALSKEVRKKFNVSASVVRTKTFTRRVTLKGTEAELVYRDNRPGLHRFATSAQKKVNVKVLKKHRPRTVKGGFRIRGKGSLVWKRLTPAEAASPKYADRKVKIKVLRTISVPEMVRGVSGSKQIQKVFLDTYLRRFDYQFGRRLGRL